MDSLLKVMKDEAIRSSPLFLLLLVTGYFGKLYIEKQFDLMNDRVSAISGTSLSIKESMREIELHALIELREHIEAWEHELMSALTGFSTTKITEKSINQFYQRESQLRLSVKKSIAKLGIVTRNEDIYLDSLSVLAEIDSLYRPYIGKYLPQLIDLQAEYEPIDARLKQGLAPDVQGESAKRLLEQAKRDQEAGRRINAKTTDLMRSAADELLELYPKLVDRLTDLKISVNRHVYRPLTSDEIDKD